MLLAIPRLSLGRLPHSDWFIVVGARIAVARRDVALEVGSGRRGVGCVLVAALARRGRCNVCPCEMIVARDGRQRRKRRVEGG